MANGGVFDQCYVFITIKMTCSFLFDSILKLARISGPNKFNLKKY